MELIKDLKSLPSYLAYAFIYLLIFLEMVKFESFSKLGHKVNLSVSLCILRQDLGMKYFALGLPQKVNSDVVDGRVP